MPAGCESGGEKASVAGVRSPVCDTYGSCGMGLIGPRDGMYAETLAAFVGSMHGPEFTSMGEPTPEIAPPLPKIRHFLISLN